MGSAMMFGFTPMETFDSNMQAWFGTDGFTGCGMNLWTGNLNSPVNKFHNIIDEKISKNATEIIVILTISNNGKKKEIRFLCDGKETQSSDVSEILKGDFLFAAICLQYENQQITTIPIDQIKKRTPEIENLIKEYQQQNNKNNNQSGGAVASSSSSSSSSSASILQLQKELAEALQEIAALSAELKKKDEEIAALKEQVESFKK
jgi:hypothetical protein